MKKIIFSLFVSIIWLINFSSASFTAVINNQNIQEYNIVNVSDIYNQYWEWFLCISSLSQWYDAMFFDNNWSVINSFEITNNNGGTACVLVDSSIAFFNNNWWTAYFNYYVAWQSSCPSANEICPNVNLRITNANDNNLWTWLRLTNYASDTSVFSNIYYSWNLQFSQSNWNLLMTCPSSDCSYYENELSECLSDYDVLWQDYDSCISELNICTPALSNCLSGWSSDLSWTNRSALFINDIQHIGNSIIDITIPEEINWDYYNTWDIFELNVSWYNVDTEYIANIIENQKTYPSDVDFNNIITDLIPKFIPWLVIILFLYFVFRFVKKIF